MHECARVCDCVHAWCMKSHMRFLICVNVYLSAEISSCKNVSFGRSGVCVCACGGGGGGGGERGKSGGGGTMII